MAEESFDPTDFTELDDTVTEVVDGIEVTLLRDWSRYKISIFFQFCKLTNLFDILVQTTCAQKMSMSRKGDKQHLQMWQGCSTRRIFNEVNLGQGQQ